ncbi:MAG: monovalent cation/H+ antiporter complex subunit F [Cellulomonadaceae bacterium]
MTVYVVIAGVLLFAAAVLALTRVERGPSMLDRTIALDVFTATLVGVIALEAAWHKRTDTLPILVVLSMVGFVGSVTIARFASVEPPDEGRIRAGRGGGTGRDRRRAAPRAQAARGRTAAAEASPERSRSAAGESEHHGGGAEGQVR